MPLPAAYMATLEGTLSPAEVLQNMLPYVDDGEKGSGILVVLLDGPEEADYGEVRDVLRFFPDRGRNA